MVFVMSFFVIVVFVMLLGWDIHQYISYSRVFYNKAGAVHYSNAGEINLILTLEWNQIVGNGVYLYGQFQYDGSIRIALDVQNMNFLFFWVWNQLFLLYIIQ